MKKIIFYSITGVICLALLLSGLLLKKTAKPVITPKKVVVKTEVPPKTTVKKPEPLKTVKTQNGTLKQVSFDQLPGWNKTEVTKSVLAFQMSCKKFLKQDPKHRVGSKLIDLRAKDWHPACEEALSLDSSYEEESKKFFEKWFYAIEFKQKKSMRGLFTGYYMPKLKGNLTKTKEFSTPIYGLPTGREDSKGKSQQRTRSRSIPYYTRQEIDNGALKKKAPVIAWINSPVERLFLEIEGSGVIQLAGGKKLYLGYAGENGAPYSSIGSELIRQGVLTKHTASNKAIKRYLDSKPEQANAILHKNKSFVFFQKLKDFFALGAQGMALTPGYSMAIDKRWIPLGTPLWLTTKIPDEENNDKKFNRLMIAQDTGGAIKGLMRGDIFWGSSKRAMFLGEHMKHEGRYWMLLPKHAFDRLANNILKKVS